MAARFHLGPGFVADSLEHSVRIDLDPRRSVRLSWSLPPGLSVRIEPDTGSDEYGRSDERLAVVAAGEARLPARLVARLEVVSPSEAADKV